MWSRLELYYFQHFARGYPSTTVLSDFFQKSKFLKLLSALCIDFFSCVRIFFLVDIRFIFSALDAKSTDCIDKCFKQKLYRIKFSYKKLNGRISFSNRSGSVGHKRFVSFEIAHWDGNVCSLWDWTLPKVLIISKNALMKNCPKSNFLQKPHWAYMSIFLSGGARGLQRFAIPIPVH